MNILVFIAGIADPKWPLPARLDSAALAALRREHPVLGPFDEAALELALKLRDDDFEVQITAVVLASSTADPLLRHVASFRLDSTHALPIERWPAWDAAALARCCRDAIPTLAHPPDLVLIGREFGDADDGSVPASIAQALALPHANLVVSLARAPNQSVTLTWQRGALQERATLELPCIASVTNDSRNRLRHPLLKNVMAARRLVFEMLEPAADDGDGCGPVFDSLRAAAPRVRATQCRFLAGDADAQADALAEILLARRASA